MSTQEYIVTVDEYGTIRWYQNGKCHRLDGPAIEYIYGDKFWYRNGQIHRIDGPAIEYANGDKSWYQNGKLHRLDGPAIQYSYGSVEYWINGERVDSLSPPVKEVTIAELEKMFNCKVKVIKGNER